MQTSDLLLIYIITDADWYRVVLEIDRAKADGLEVRYSWQRYVEASCNELAERQ